MVQAMKIDKIPEGYEVAWIRPCFEGNIQTMQEEFDRRDRVVESIRSLARLSSGYEGKEVYGRGRQMAGVRSGEEGIFKGITEGEVGVYFSVGSKAFVLSTMEVLAVKKEMVFVNTEHVDKSSFELSSRLD